MKYIWLLFLPNALFGWSANDTFNQHLNQHFVETGSHIGEGIEKAIRTGFPHIHSIELSEELYLYCKMKFDNQPIVALWQGDSSIILEQVIKNIHEPITFWLDGHYSGDPAAKGTAYSPILMELEAIKQHPIKNHIILIDDVRLFGTAHFDFITLDEIKSKLLEINPGYVFTFQDGYQQNDVLVAKI